MARPSSTLFLEFPCSLLLQSGCPVVSTITCRIYFVTVTVTAFVGSNTIKAMSFSVRATPSNLVSYPELCWSVLRPLHAPTQANQFERNYDARRLCNWEVRRHMHAGGLINATKPPPAHT